MPAFNVVLHGKQRWIFIGKEELEKLEKLLGRDLFRGRHFVNPAKLREMGIEFVQVIVEAGQAVFVPIGVLHCVFNLEPETVAVAWNIMLPEHFTGALQAFHCNRILLPGLDVESENSKVRFQELAFRIQYHSVMQTRTFLELERYLGKERTVELALTVQFVFDELVGLEHLDWMPPAVVASNFGDHDKVFEHKQLLLKGMLNAFSV